MNLEIVSHCWHYSRPLTFQLSSLYLFPPSITTVTMTVFYSESDFNTVDVLRYFTDRPAPPNVVVRSWALPPDRITRRMIGRNLAALSTNADWVWFTDCDYVFRAGCLDSLSQWNAAPEELLFFPKCTYLSRTHQDGDCELARVASEVSLVDIDPKRYVAKRLRRAIGGIQIVRGELARHLGYCRQSRYQQIPSASWAPNRDDIWFRRSLGTAGVAMDVPAVYRIRHSMRGGDVLDGNSITDEASAHTTEALVRGTLP